METAEIKVRDPYILPYEGKYYLFGTRSMTAWGPADGFDCYISEDLQEWSDPIEAFHKPEDFFATEKYWAPECFCYRDAFYLFATFASESVRTCMYILKAERPEGPYSVHSEQVTPPGWASIDGTLYVDEGVPYLVFSRTFEDVPDGQFWYVRLTPDLKKADGEPQLLFKGTDAPWVRPIPFAKSDLGIDGDVCPVFKEGQTFITGGIFGNEMPEGFCAMAWQALVMPVNVLVGGGKVLGLDERHIACCTDGVRPAIFLLERVEDREEGK